VSSEVSYRTWRSVLFPELPQWDHLETPRQDAELLAVRLLLQMEQYDRSGEWFGSNGHLFFFIREDDLRKRRFDKVWAEVE